MRPSRSNITDLICFCKRYVYGAVDDVGIDQRPDLVEPLHQVNHHESMEILEPPRPEYVNRVTARSVMLGA